MCLLFWCHKSAKKKEQNANQEEEKKYLLKCFGCNEISMTNNVFYNSHAGLFGLCEACTYDLNHFEL